MNQNTNRNIFAGFMILAIAGLMLIPTVFAAERGHGRWNNEYQRYNNWDRSNYWNNDYDRNYYGNRWNNGWRNNWHGWLNNWWNNGWRNNYYSR